MEHRGCPNHCPNHCSVTLRSLPQSVGITLTASLM